MKSNKFAIKDYIEELRKYKHLDLLDFNKKYYERENKITNVFTYRNIYYENLDKIIIQDIILIIQATNI